MTVNLNNKTHSLPPETTLKQLVSLLEIDTGGIAIAINNQVITRSNWEAHILKENDNILIIRATQGG